MNGPSPMAAASNAKLIAQSASHRLNTPLGNHAEVERQNNKLSEAKPYGTLTVTVAVVRPYWLVAYRV